MSNFIKTDVNEIRRNYEPICNHKELIEKAKTMLSSSNKIELLCALMLITGRRLTELLDLSFSSRKEKHKKGELILMYEFPCLINEDFVLLAIKSLKGKIPNKTLSNEDIVKYIKDIDLVAKKMLNSHIQNPCIYDLRKAYACLQLANEYTTGQKSRAYILSEILGIGSVSIQSIEKFYI